MSNYIAAYIAAIHQQPEMTFRMMSVFVEHRFFDKPDLPVTAVSLLAAGLPEEKIGRVLRIITDVDPAPCINLMRKLNVTMIQKSDEAYPPLLKEIPSPPPVLYVRGNVAALHHPALAVVGTRRATVYGLRVTTELVAPVARRGICIVSGLAKGIDGVAHRAALEEGAPTVAVLGCGIDQVYPWEHRELAERIVAAGGAVISEFPIGAKPERHHFPQRNRIISGLSRAVLVVEAGEKSGALVTAKFAVDQNRDVLGVPGSLFSEQSIGVHNWLKLGAKLVTSSEDILELFSLAGGSARTTPTRPMGDTPDERLLLSMLGSDPVHIDELSEKSRLDTSVVSATLALMEIKGTIRHDGGMTYTLA